MLIESIRSIRVPVALVDPLRTSHGTHHGRIASLVEVTTKDGHVGWGEDVAPDGVSYVGDSPAESFASMRTLAELAGHRTIDVAEMFSESWWGVSGHHFAKHAIESALWAAHSSEQGISLQTALGGTYSHITPGVVVGVQDSLDALESLVASRIAEGYRRIKLKIQPEWDTEVVRFVRDLVGQDFALQVDANAAYTADDIDLLIHLEEFNLQFIEQPFAADQLSVHAELSKLTATPICLDESIMNVNDMMSAIEQRACSVVNIKPSRLGGLADAIRLEQIATSHDIVVWVGGMLETGVGRASCLALASRPGFTLSPDLSASQRYFSVDVTESFQLIDGRIEVPRKVGLGVEPLPWVFEHPEVKIETLFSA